MNTRSTTRARRSFLATLAAGAAGLLVFPFRKTARAAASGPAASAAPPPVRPHPDAVPRTSRGDSAHG